MPYSRKFKLALITVCAIIVNVISGCATTPTIPVLMINFGEFKPVQEIHLWGKTYSLDKQAEAIAKQEVQTMLEETKGLIPTIPADSIEDQIRKEIGK